jgi:alkylation response protein AidB-like acyl-CoA dehydrogenase
MANRTTEDIIGTLYDMVQDARSMPLAMDKCILERDKVLDLLDEIIAQLPVELKQARTIVESRADLICQGKREKEVIIRKAQEQAKELVAQEAVTKEAKRVAEEIEQKANDRAIQIQKAGNAYMDESLRQTEEVIAQALADIQATREKFRAITESLEQRTYEEEVEE